MYHFRYYTIDPSTGRLVQMGGQESPTLPPDLASMFGMTEQSPDNPAGSFSVPGSVPGANPNWEILNQILNQSGTPQDPNSPFTGGPTLHWGERPEPHTDVEYMRREVAALDITPVLMSALLEAIEAYEYLVYGGDEA